MNKKLLFIIMIVICFIGLLYGSYKVFNWKKDNDKTQEIKDIIDEYIKIDDTQEDSKYNIDFDNLKKKNPDTVAYLKVNNTNIDYIVVKSKDNSY